MKKIIILICLICCGFSANAQIQRRFWGLELGISTKEDVKRVLIANGCEYEQNTGGADNIASFGLEGLSFGGYSWSPIFAFDNNILYRVTMIMMPWGIGSEGETYNINTSSIFHQLRSILSSKYSNAEIISTSTPQSLFIARDSRTVVALEIHTNKELGLDYYDRKITRRILNGNDL
jgi:hypothetical protein